MALIIAGRIVPMSNVGNVADSESARFKGKLWIDDAGLIAAVTRGTSAGPSGFDNAPVVDVGDDWVVPGFIDMHNHLAYATLPLWAESGRTEAFKHRDIWPNRPTYAEQVTWPAYAFIESAPAELLAYAEVRALVGGVTSIQGSPPSNKPLDGWLVRNIEDETLGGKLNAHQVLASVLTLKPEQLADRAGKMRNGATFIYHCAEGQPGSIVTREYRSAHNAGCLQHRFVAIHTNAVDANGYDQWQEAGSIVWSPFSNLWLYGATTDVPSALAHKLNVCIGSDWGPSGTRNILGEIKVASLVNDANTWGLSAVDLVKMITANPGDVLGNAWGVQAGRLQPGALADITVIRASGSADPFDTIVRATEKDVRFVVIGGQALYGTAALMKQARATRTSMLKVAGESRRIALTQLERGGTPKPWSFAAVLKRLKEVRANPKQEIERSRALAYAAIRNNEPPRLRLALDMPTGRVPIGGLPKDLGTIVVPPIQPLVHDKAFFDSIQGRGFHGGLLDKLRSFYA